MIQLVNLTDDVVINILMKSGEIRSIVRPKDVNPARIMSHQQVVRIINGIEVKKTVIDGINDLPPAQPGVYYITSYLVAIYAQRNDVLCPNSYPKEIYRQDGEVLLVKSLQSLV
jgi:hypothetical protein